MRKLKILDPLPGCPDWCSRCHEPFEPGVSVIHRSFPLATIEPAEDDETEIVVRRSMLQDSDGLMLDELLELDVTGWGQRVQVALTSDERHRLATILTGARCHGAPLAISG